MGNRDRRITAHQRQLKALELRLAGCSYEQIAREVGYASRSGAHKSVESALRQSLREPADELRAISAERLDRVTLAVWRAANAGDLRAIDVLLRIEARRARLLGYDAPLRGEISGPEGKPLALDLKGLSDEELALLEVVHAKLATQSR